MARKNSWTKYNTKLLIFIGLILLALVATANFTIFSKKISNLGNSQASAILPADINSDGIVDIADLSVLLSNWSKTGTNSDLNSDNNVDIVDLSILLSKWGATASQTTTEKYYSKYPDPFVRASDNVPVRMNGLNYRDVGRYSTVDQADFDAAKAKGFNAMRFVLYWKDFETNKGQFNQLQLDRLDQAVARAKAAGIDVILDPLHAVNPKVQPYFPTWAVDEAIANKWDSTQSAVNSGLPFLRMIADRYKDEDAVIAIDLLNEPNQFPIGQGPWESSQVSDWPRLLETFNVLISNVRAIDPDKILMIEPNNGDHNPTSADFSLLDTKENIVWSPHFYYAGGADADGYSSGGWFTGNNVSDGISGYPTVDRDSLDRHIAVQVNKMQQVGLPIHIGEYGIGDGSVDGELPPFSNVPTNQIQWIIDTKAVFDKYNLSRTMWEWRSRGSFSAVYMKTGANNITGYPESGTWKPWVDYVMN